jgi:hypothetical protein
MHNRPMRTGPTVLRGLRSDAGSQQVNGGTQCVQRLLHPVTRSLGIELFGDSELRCDKVALRLQQAVL